MNMTTTRFIRNTAPMTGLLRSYSYTGFTYRIHSCPERFSGSDGKRVQALLSLTYFWFPTGREFGGLLFTAPAAFKLAAVRGTGLSSLAPFSPVCTAFAGAERTEAAVVLLGAMGKLSGRKVATLTVDLEGFT